MLKPNLEYTLEENYYRYVLCDRYIFFPAQPILELIVINHCALLLHAAEQPLKLLDMHV